MEPTKKLLEAIAVCAELTGTQLSDGAAKVFAADLARYPEQQVMGALSRCRRELKGRLTLADVISRLDDGRPGVEEAWGMVPRDEQVTVVWTEEMALAMSAAHNLMDDGDMIGARMAFKEKYTKLCQMSRDEGKPVVWSASIGYDAHGREGVLIEAYKKGRLSKPQVQVLLPTANFDNLPECQLDDVGRSIKRLADAMKAAA